MEADLEIGRVWDRDRRHLRVGLRFDVPGTATDDWLAAAQPLSLDLDRLDAARQKWSQHRDAGPRATIREAVRDTPGRIPYVSDPCDRVAVAERTVTASAGG